VRKRYPLGCSGAAWALGRSGTAWALARQSARTARLSVCGSAGLQAADGDDLLLGPDLQREGAAAAGDDSVGAVVQLPQRRHGAAAADPDQPGVEELGRQLAGLGQAGTGIVPGQGKSRNRGI
jgi:hypothetical protein